MADLKLRAGDRMIYEGRPCVLVRPHEAGLVVVRFQDGWVARVPACALTPAG